METWNTLASKETIEKTIAALTANGIQTELLKTGAEAKKRVQELLPKGAEVMDMTSVTLDALGISEDIQKSGSYDAIKTKLFSLDRTTQAKEIQKLGAAPDWAIGSVHAVTEDGHVLIASNTGSQLPAYVYGSSHVIWIVGTQKIVKDMQKGMQRINDYVLPLESERAKKAYGVPGSFISKLLIINKEIVPGRINLLFVNEVVGF